MIISFRHKGLRIFHETGNTRAIQASHAKRLKRQLQFLDRAMAAQDLSVPGWQFVSWVRMSNWTITLIITEKES